MRLILCPLILALIGGVACEPSTPESESVTAPQKKRYSLIIGIDGVRPDALVAASTPAIDQLIANGLSTMNATTQLSAATSSGPGWMSILTGVEPSKHGVYSNGDYSNRNSDYSTFLWHGTHGYDLTTLTTVAWPELVLQIVETDASDLIRIQTEEESTVFLEDELANLDYEMTFLHLDTVDHAGHASGFSADNPEYIDAIEIVDGQIQRILTAIDSRASRQDEEWLIAVTTDHGGEGTSHGALSEACRTIFLILSGDALKTGQIPPDPQVSISHMDVFPSVVEYLRLPPKEDWQLDGRSRLDWVSAP